ncbi:MAG: hypothetical protein FJX62_13280 [Alphaproteobacteria bacterium]|nr:hypothetical protein [Alphaproteobacteria bacterium]
MQRSTKISPPNSIVFVEDLKGGEPPNPIWGATILATPSCISVACYPEQDGPTEIALGNVPDVDPGFEPEFDGYLETPSRIVVVSTVDQKVVLDVPAPASKSRLRIWRNHPKWPTKVNIGLG